VWTIENNTPFSAKGAIKQHYATNRKIWVVAVKATFDIASDGELTIAEEQAEVLEEPVYFGEELESSLRYDTDLTQTKEKIDIIVNATGYHPNDEAGKELLVGISIGDWKKILTLKGDRMWDRFLGIPFQTNARPFKRMSVRYENAFGGKDDTAKLGYEVDHRNTIGKGYSFRTFRLLGKRLPNIEYPDFPTRRGYKKNKIAGFGAIANHWRPRIDYGGTFDETWRETRAPLYPMDFSPRFFQSAPPDQWISNLKGGEDVRLYHLSPDRTEIAFRLPKLDLRFSTKIDKTKERHQGTIQTVIIEPDIAKLMMVWQTSLDCQDMDHLVETTHVDCEIIRI